MVEKALSEQNLVLVEPGGLFSSFLLKWYPCHLLFLFPKMYRYLMLCGTFFSFFIVSAALACEFPEARDLVYFPFTRSSTLTIMSSPC